MSAVLYWAVVAALLAATATFALVIWRLVRRAGHRVAHIPQRIVGIATRADIAPVASKRALVHRGQTLRPSPGDPRAEDLGYLLGRACGKEIWASVEDSILVVGPPRSGKGLHLDINAGGSTTGTCRRSERFNVA